MTRYRASATHLLLSLAVAAAVFIAVRMVWYPGVLFDGAGGRDLFLLIVAVDVTLGPLITLIIFKPGKKGLRFDLVVIAMLQLAALGYGLWAISLSRPVHVAFVKDRFELTRASDIETTDLAKARDPAYASLSWSGPEYIGVDLPVDPKEQFDLMVSATSGKDVHTYPKYFVPYAKHAAVAARKAAPLAQLRKLNPARAAEVDAIPGRVRRAESELGFLPLKTDRGDLAVILDVRDGKVLELLALRPWEY